MKLLIALISISLFSGLALARGDGGLPLALRGGDGSLPLQATGMASNAQEETEKLLELEILTGELSETLECQEDFIPRNAVGSFKIDGVAYAIEAACVNEETHQIVVHATDALGAPLKFKGTVEVNEDSETLSGRIVIKEHEKEDMTRYVMKASTKVDPPEDDSEESENGESQDQGSQEEATE